MTFAFGFIEENADEQVSFGGELSHYYRLEVCGFVLAGDELTVVLFQVSPIRRES